MVDMIKERNIYKAWVSIQKLTKHTMNLRFMYFKELLNAHTKNAIHHSFYYIHIWITARLGIILVHCINLLNFWKILKRFSIRLIFFKTCLQHYPDCFYRSVPKLLYYVLQSVSIICIPNLFTATLFTDHVIRKRIKRLTIKFSPDIFNTPDIPV